MLDLLTLKDNMGREDDGVDALRVLVLDRVSFYLLEGLGSKPCLGLIEVLTRFRSLVIT